MFLCEVCKKEFPYKSFLDRHLNSKKKCSSIKKIDYKEYNKKTNEIDEKIIECNNNIAIYDHNISKLVIKINKIIKKSYDSNKYMCNFCTKTFLIKGNMIRHIKTNCFKKKEINENINKFKEDKNKIQDERKNLEDNKLKLIQERDRQEKEIEKLKLIDEMNKLRKDIAKLLDKQSIQNITINNNTQNNLIININSFGKEDLSHITNTDYKKFFNGFFPGFIKYIQKTHFDEQVPQNHNICITNIKSKYIYVYENGNWQLKERDYIIDKLITKKYVMLTDKFDKLEENNEIDEKTIENFNEFMENYDDNEAQKNTKNDVILMIYNNKDKLKNKP